LLRRAVKRCRAADISDEAQVLAMFDSLDREGEPLTALVNNAGILFEQSTIEACPPSALTACWRPTSRAIFSAAGKR
jgi:NAD(P)-dependent dehydrogenase (short-subunit alcohol dehydrogenase family)